MTVRRRRTAAALALAAALVASLAAVAGEAADPVSSAWRDALVHGEEAHAEVPPQHAVMHEWWYFTVHAPAGGACGPWQAMVAFVADVEAGADHLFFTTVVDGVPADRSEDHALGSLVRATTEAPAGTALALGDSTASGRFGAWTLDVRTAGASLSLALDAVSGTWRRRAPEGAGVIEGTFTPRAAASGTLTIGERTCTGATVGYYEHIWGNWSRVPMWGVDFLSAHLDNGWSVVARVPPMRGEESFYPRFGQDSRDFWPPSMIVFDGTRVAEARDVAFEVLASDEVHPTLGIPLPARYRVTGSFSTCPECDVLPQTIELTVEDPVLATIPLVLSSGILEGVGAASLTVDGAPAGAGVAEVEIQRYGTAYPR